MSWVGYMGPALCGDVADAERATDRVSQAARYIVQVTSHCIMSLHYVIRLKCGMGLCEADSCLGLPGAVLYCRLLCFSYPSWCPSWCSS